jgi:hypothetical protein
MPKTQTVSFFGTCGASANACLVSQQISGAFDVKKIRASFAPGVNRLMTLKFFISPDPQAPTTARPNGVNILQQTGQANYITGDNEFKEFVHEVQNPTRNAWLKVYAENTDTFAHTIDAQVTIEYID